MRCTTVGGYEFIQTTQGSYSAFLAFEPYQRYGIHGSSSPKPRPHKFGELGAAILAVGASRVSWLSWRALPARRERGWGVGGGGPACCLPPCHPLLNDWGRPPFPPSQQAEHETVLRGHFLEILSGPVVGKALPSGGCVDR